MRWLRFAAIHGLPESQNPYQVEEKLSVIEISGRLFVSEGSQNDCERIQPDSQRAMKAYTAIFLVFAFPCYGQEAQHEWHMVPGTEQPVTMAVSSSESSTRPDLHIDVTAYGAKGNASHDDTSAIQSAINAYCLNPSLSGGGSVYFPPGTYLVNQPQKPSTSPVFTICSGIHFLGGNVGAHEQPFIRSPNVSIIVQPGSNPNAGPVFECVYPSCSGGVTFEKLNIIGYNQVVYINGASVNRWVDTTLTTWQGGATGLADNTALKLCNSIWNWYEGGEIATNKTTAIPAVLICAEPTHSGFTQAGLTYFENVLMAGGGFLYDQRVVNVGAPAGDFVFRNITREGGGGSDFFKIQSEVGAIAFTGATFDVVSDSDLSSGTPALINFNASGVLTGVIINHSYSSHAIRMTHGTLNQAFITGCQYACATDVIDELGNLVSGAVIQNLDGFDYFVNTSDNNQRLRNDMSGTYAPTEGSIQGPALRVSGTSGKSTNFATLGVDSSGLLLSEGRTYGFSSKINQTATNTIDLSFSKLLPPTNVEATATRGGTLAPGTYYYFMRSTSTGISTQCTDSSVSIPSGPVVVSGGNNAVAVTWMLPVSAVNGESPHGYCLYRSQSALNTAGDGSALMQVILGGTTTSFLDTGGGSGGNTNSPVPTHVAVHRFTATSLGIGNTSPAYNLDVSGTGRFTSSLISGAYRTTSNCSSSSSPAVCGAAAAGNVIIAAGSTTVTVNTTAVTENSEIFLQADDTVDKRLGVTCNTVNSTLTGGLAVIARTAGRSFQISNNGIPPMIHPLCISYHIVN